MLKKKILVRNSTDPQNTVVSKVVIVGPSAYSAEPSKLVIRPAATDFGIQFKVGNKLIPCLIRYAKFDNSEHTTSLSKDGVEIKTVEHLLSALWGMGIDNAMLELESNALIPTPDGSAEYYSRALSNVGIKPQSANRRYLVFKNLHKFIESKEEPRYAIFSPSESTSIDSTTAFDNLVGKNTVKYDDEPSTYLSNISWARTFLRSPLDDEGAIWQHMKKIFPALPDDHTKSPIIIFNDERFFTPLKSPDEPARHKVLDFVGDMALLGMRVKASVELFLPGHRFTRMLVRELSEALT